MERLGRAWDREKGQEKPAKEAGKAGVGVRGREARKVGVAGDHQRRGGCSVALGFDPKKLL